MKRPKQPNRPSSADRGYDGEHRKRRRLWAPRVAVGDVNCWRCGLLIPPGGHGICPAILESGRRCLKNHRSWHLGHDDHDRTVWRGPEHVCCNVGAFWRRRNAQKPPQRNSQVW
jgi:hypothetical protein